MKDKYLKLKRLTEQAYALLQKYEEAKKKAEEEYKNLFEVYPLEEDMGMENYAWADTFEAGGETLNMNELLSQAEENYKRQKGERK